MPPAEQVANGLLVGQGPAEPHREDVGVPVDFGQ
jgi:hypothetical protein